MTKLSKANIKERDALCVKLRAAHDALEAAVEAFNAALAAEWEKVEMARDAYNAEIQDANSWRSELAQEVQDYIDDKSDKWQEGDKGQAVSAFKDALGEDLPEVELEQPEELRFDHEATADVIEQMPEEAGSVMSTLSTFAHVLVAVACVLIAASAVSVFRRGR